MQKGEGQREPAGARGLHRSESREGPQKGCGGEEKSLSERSLALSVEKELEVGRLVRAGEEEEGQRDGNSLCLPPKEPV